MLDSTGPFYACDGKVLLDTRAGRFPLAGVSTFGATYLELDGRHTHVVKPETMTFRNVGWRFESFVNVIPLTWVLVCQTGFEKC